MTKIRSGKVDNIKQKQRQTEEERKKREKYEKEGRKRKVCFTLLASFGRTVANDHLNGHGCHSKDLSKKMLFQRFTIASLI